MELLIPVLVLVGFTSSIRKYKKKQNVYGKKQYAFIAI
jgi:hypothetical protein